MTTAIKFLLAAFCIFCFYSLQAQTADSTYAEKLGYPKGAKVVILHVDDAGMSYDSNEGAEQAITKGVATSCSVMMPCPWVPGFVHFLHEHPTVDAGLHLTLTSEWSDYRWAPLSGKPLVPGLVDSEGAMWHEVADVVMHSNADEVYTEIKAQLERARSMGFQPTHLDSHMGTLFASFAFTQQYMRLGIENHIPVMMPGGKATMIRTQMHSGDAVIQQMQAAGKMLWSAGLPVLDDLHNLSYDWNMPDSVLHNDKKLQRFRTKLYTESLKQLQPGITMVIMHCTATTEVFEKISDSGPLRKGDLL
ncbi:MAG TPA: polysaccharide deacetylase family protein, partial [Chitinophagaceae bacterium]|nr:polysaccharide deacetylase family protein [Chitinophagaceae bacterium]